MSTEGSPLNLPDFPIHLGVGATAVRQPRFDGRMEWYQGYAERHNGDGAEGRLVAMNDFDADWDSWEMHPKGHEVVIVTAGTLILVQQLLDGTVVETELAAGQATINEPGVWHTARCKSPGTVLFITAGEGTEHGPGPDL